MNINFNRLFLYLKENKHTYRKGGGVMIPQNDDTIHTKNTNSKDLHII